MGSDVIEYLGNRSNVTGKESWWSGQEARWVSNAEEGTTNRVKWESQGRWSRILSSYCYSICPHDIGMGQTIFFHFVNASKAADVGVDKGG